MKTIKQIVHNNRKTIAIYIVIGVVIAFLTNYKLKLFQQIIDGFTARSITLGSIVIYGGVLISFYLLNYIDEYPAKKLENGIYLDLKIFALKKISRIDYMEYQSLGTGELTQRIENGASAGKEVVFDFWLCVVRQLLPTVLFSVYFIWRLNPLITYILLGGYVIIFFITRWLLKFLYGIKEKILCDEERMNHYLVRGFMEMVVFRLNRRFPSEIKRVTVAKDDIVSSKVKMNMIHEAFFTLFALLVAILNIGVLVYAWMNPQISIGTTVALLSLIENAYTPIAIFNVLFVTYKLNLAGFHRYDEFLQKREDSQLTSGKRIDKVEGNIEIKDLTYAYGTKKVINNVDLAIKQGEKIALVGSSGSGKTTLIQILLGLLKYDDGSIKIDGNNLDEICLEDYYRSVSYISQDTPVFDGTMKENIVLEQDVSEDELHTALKSVRLDDVVEKMEEGINTLVGERGITLSGGERQRVALARLWFHKNQLVILDEATSALDNITEEEVMKAVMAHLEGSTVIAIAHRLTSIIGFDRILVFDDGQIVEQGTFDELLQKGGYFTELYNGKFIEE